MVLQCISYEFPCALKLKMWGILNEVKCRLGEKCYKEKQIDSSNSVESVGHIQCYCPVLKRPLIAIHHGIWKELMCSIRKSCTEPNDRMEPRLHFPSALSPEAHAEWGLYKILEYMWLHTRRGTKQNQTQKRYKRIPPGLQYRLRRGRPRNLHLPQTRWASLRQRKEIMCVPKIQQSNGHQRGLGHEEATGERRQIQYIFRLNQPPQQARKERLKSHTNQLHNGSTRLSTYKSISNQTGNTRSEEQKHKGSHPEQDSPKNYVWYDPQVLFHCTQLQDRVDTPIPTHKNYQQKHGSIQSIPLSYGATIGPHSTSIRKSVHTVFSPVKSMWKLLDTYVATMVSQVFCAPYVPIACVMSVQMMRKISPVKIYTHLWNT